MPIFFTLKFLAHCLHKRKILNNPYNSRLKSYAKFDSLWNFKLFIFLVLKSDFYSLITCIQSIGYTRIYC